MQTPKSVSLPEAQDHPAGQCVLTLVSVVQDALIFGTSDLFPVIVSYEDGQEDIALALQVQSPDGAKGVVIAGLLLNKGVTSEPVKEWALETQRLLGEHLGAPVVATPDAIETTATENADVESAVQRAVDAALDEHDAEVEAEVEADIAAFEEALADDPEDAAAAVEEVVNRAVAERYAAEEDES